MTEDEYRRMREIARDEHRPLGPTILHKALLQAQREQWDAGEPQPQAERP